jgi:hypothetical protein
VSLDRLLQLQACEGRADAQKRHIELLQKQIAEMKAEITMLKSQAASTLTELVTAVTAVTTGAMEVLPVRPDSRQFLTWRVNGIPPPLLQFDRPWCAAVCASGGDARLDAAVGDVRATVTRGGAEYFTLRSAAPLPRDTRRSGRQYPAYRIIVERYGEAGEWCCLGFIPSHQMHGSGAAPLPVAPTPDYGICNYGGWYIAVFPTRAGVVNSDTQYSGWTVMPPAISAYATRADVPPVPAGGAVEFAVDYAAGTCRVAFYTPAAVAGGFVQAPYDRLELRFVATPAGHRLPARTVPTAADSGVALYPAVSTLDCGNAWRFAAD